MPARALGLALLGALTAEGTQAIGALLVLGLIAATAGAAQRLTVRPLAGMGLSAAIALVALWGVWVWPMPFPSLPPSTAVVALLVVAYLSAALVARLRAGRGDGGSTTGAFRSDPAAAPASTIEQ